MILKDLVIVLVIYFSNGIESKIMCKNENNKDLDWYIIIKYPNSFNFTYLSSESSKNSWQKPLFDLNSDKNMAAVTLKQAYNSKKEETFYAFYNDESPDHFNARYAGHLKGAINFDSESGYWIIHSIPRFPPSEKYYYTNPQDFNGHSLICVSIKSTHLDTLARYMPMMFPNVYSFNLPVNFTNNIELATNLRRLVSNNYIAPIVLSLVKFETPNNISLLHLLKTNQINEDIYAYFVSTQLGSNLYVKSWLNGKDDRLPSNCSYGKEVYNIKNAKINGYEFDNSNDHSKWAVTSSKKIGATCIGDANRRKSQMIRASGVMCIYQPDVWRAFNSALVDYEKCNNANLITNIFMLNTIVFLILFYLKSEMW